MTCHGVVAAAWEPAADRFRIATWNVNSLKVRAPALERLLERARPDVVLLQETKASAVHPTATVTQPERDALTRLFDNGLVDLDAARWGAHERRFTWCNHGLDYSRNLGMRIDSSPPMLPSQAGSTRRGSTTSSAAPSGRPITPRCWPTSTCIPSVPRG